MIGILVAIKSILEIKAVAGALGALDAGLNIAGLLKILRFKVKRNSIEYQIICTIDDSLKAACKELGWEYDALAVSQEMDPGKLLNSTVMTKAELGRLFSILVGSDIEDCDLDVIIDCFDKSVAGKDELHRYLDMKWKRYIEGETIPPTDETDAQKSFDFSSYYESVIEDFMEEKDNDSVELLGSESDDNAYIEQFITVGHEQESALQFLSDWFEEKKYGTLLICGEPGHGKSLLCKKAVVEYIRGRFLNAKAQNVLVVSLNTGENPSIIPNKKEVNYENMLAWGPIREHKFGFEDCRESLLFMDGFDEFIDEAKKANVKDIVSFMHIIERIAKEYKIHIVILSRLIAVQNDLIDPEICKKSFKLSPITKEQQTEWVKKRNDYSDYSETLLKLQNDKDMSVLLGIPLLFRMIVHTQYNKVSSNIVELYDGLFEHLMRKRRIRGAVLEKIRQDLSDHAYKVYCNDEDTAEVEEEERDENWVFAFYVKAGNGGKVGFFHRSFYQYFLAKYVYTGILSIKSIGAKTYVGRFAERELDDTVCQYLSLMIKKMDLDTIHNSLNLMIETLVWTEAYLNLEPRFPSGNAEKSKRGRTYNIYRNIIHLCSTFSYVIQKPFRQGIDVFLRQYNNYGISLLSDEKRRANLINADLKGAFLKSADLYRANLSRAKLDGANLCNVNLYNAMMDEASMILADMRGVCLEKAFLRRAVLSGANLESFSQTHRKGKNANLCKANLVGAFLVGSKLRNANLSGAKMGNTKMSEAILSEACLRGATLFGAILEEANLRKADLTEAKLKSANLSRANLSEANLTKADLSGADLSEADLSGAILMSTNLEVKRFYYTVISIDNKEFIDSSIEGYETIVWVNKQKNGSNRPVRAYDQKR